MSETTVSTEAEIVDLPTPKKNLFSKKNLAIAGATATSVAVAVLAFVKFGSDDEVSEGLEVDEQPAFETTIDVTTPDQS
jgi:hypothetical protein